MIVIFAIILTEPAVMNVNTHVLQDLISLLKVSDATLLLIYLFFFESSLFYFFNWEKLFSFIISLEHHGARDSFISVSINLMFLMFCSAQLAFVYFA